MGNVPMPEKPKNTSTAEGSCFLDTGIFFAAYNKNDSMHLDGTLALVSSQLGWFGRVYTSTYVIDEALTLTKVKMGGHHAVRLANDITQSRKITRLKVDDDQTVIRDAMDQFKRHSDVRGLSFTDCTTLVLRERLKIDILLSFDRGFRPFVPRLLGEGYQDSLSDDRREILRKVMERLDVNLDPATS